MMSEFIERRLRQLEPAGATLTMNLKGLTFGVSTIKMGDAKYTRVTLMHDKARMIHFEGILSVYEAALAFSNALEVIDDARS